jgi:hypothetical protein
MDPNGAQRAGVLGVGTMGADIVKLAAQTGHEVVACDRSVEAIERAQPYVRDGLSRFVGRGAFSEEDAGRHYHRASTYGSQQPRETPAKRSIATHRCTTVHESGSSKWHLPEAHEVLWEDLRGSGLQAAKSVRACHIPKAFSSHATYQARSRKACRQGNGRTQ